MPRVNHSGIHADNPDLAAKNFRQERVPDGAGKPNSEVGQNSPRVPYHRRTVQHVKDVNPHDQRASTIQAGGIDLVVDD